MKEKIKLESITSRQYLSLSDASEYIGVDSHEIMNIVRQLGMRVFVLFGKYTVFTCQQVSQIGAYLGRTVNAGLARDQKVL